MGAGGVARGFILPSFFLHAQPDRAFSLSCAGQLVTEMQPVSETLH